MYADRLYKRPSQTINNNFDALKEEILKENETLINNKFNEFFEKFKNKFDNIGSQSNNISKIPSSTTNSTNKKLSFVILKMKSIFIKF